MNNQNIHITLEEWEEIEAYLNHTLPAGQLQFFEERLKMDSNLPAKINQVKLRLLAVEEAGIRADLETFHQRLNNKPVVAINTSSRTNKFKWVAAAAVIIAIATTALFFLQQSGSREQLFTGHYKPDPGLSTTMSQTDNYEFEKAMVEYKSGNYTKALAGWEKLLSSKPDNDTLHYFIANAHLATGNQEGAIEHFEKVLPVANSEFINESYWYLGLVYIKKNDKQKAITYLQQSKLPAANALLKQLE